MNMANAMASASKVIRDFRNLGIFAFLLKFGIFLLLLNFGLYFFGDYCKSAASEVCNLGKYIMLVLDLGMNLWDRNLIWGGGQALGHSNCHNHNMYDSPKSYSRSLFCNLGTNMLIPGFGMIPLG